MQRTVFNLRYYDIAAAVVLLMAVYPVMRLVSPSTDAPVYSIYDDDSYDWADFADADLFMDNMNW